MRPTVADVVRDHTDALRALRGGWLPYPVERALRDLGQCRTAALGGHLYVCTSCGVEVPVYNSCQAGRARIDIVPSASPGLETGGSRRG